MRLLGCGLCLHHSSSVQYHQTIRETFFFSWLTKTVIQKESDLLVCVEAGSEQHRKTSKLLCDVIVSLGQERYAEKPIVKISLRSLYFLHWY